jgi:hypothetical protein
LKDCEVWGELYGISERLVIMWIWCNFPIGDIAVFRFKIFSAYFSKEVFCGQLLNRLGKPRFIFLDWGFSVSVPI